MRSDMRRAIVFIAASFSLMGCASFRKPGPLEPDAVVVFRNDSPDQADVYAIGSGGDPMRIGTVFAGRTETLRVPATITGGGYRVNVLARLFPGGRVIASGAFSLGPGDSMTVRLTADEKILSVLPTSEE
ncbi:MAG TPA: hypothetical protein VH539_24140 [Gemmatimonadaceae bacterium]|jgi:hypothetical protein